MDQKSVWAKYILAQQKILENKSRPIAIDLSKHVRIQNNKLQLCVDQEIFKSLAKEEIKKIFRLNQFEFTDGYILQDLSITEKISKEELLRLRSFAIENYIDFGEFPIIEGEITQLGGQNDPFFNLPGANDAKPLIHRNGTILLTLVQKDYIEKTERIALEDRGGAVFNISPSVLWLFPSFYWKYIVISRDKISVSGGLQNDIRERMKQNIDLSIKSYTLTFEIIGVPNLNHELSVLLSKGFSLPKSVKNVLNFDFSFSWLQERGSSLAAEHYRINKSLKTFFPNADITFNYTEHYRFDNQKAKPFRDPLADSEEFWNKLYTEVHGDRFQVSAASRTISFDFYSLDELNEKLKDINLFDFAEIYDRGDNHKFKFRIKVNKNLNAVKKRLQEEIPTLSFRFGNNGQSLIFSQSYAPGNKGFVRDGLDDQIHKLVDQSYFKITFHDTFQERYKCEENFEMKAAVEEERLTQLRREDFYFGDVKNKFFIGNLSKVSYPEIDFLIESDKLETVKSNLEKGTLQAIFPDLKGERDKIIRLSDAIGKLEPDVVIPNGNAKKFLFDSSSAQPIDHIDDLIDEDGEGWKDFELQVYSKTLNASQKRAVFKALNAPELALIQGPPGTGKSTAIAEIIWQHVRRNQSEKILLTSETNLAVDNAIDRLKNNRHNLVKPIRFGKNEKLESEGKFCSLETIENWVSGVDVGQNNTVAHWMKNIALRVVANDNPEIETLLDKWRSILQNPEGQERELFSEEYIKHANLIGATGSSIGKLNSEGHFTSFFNHYLNVFHRNISVHNLSKKKCMAVNITFDTVVMDEASKATPPELALPVLYSKKAIIVGDHRQLPPMVDGEEMKDVLERIGEIQLAKSLFRNSFEKSQFENLFEHIDPSLKGTFDTQYRMHPTINDVIAQFYVKEGGLRCGLPLDEDFHHSFQHPMSRFHGLEIPGILETRTHVLWIDVDSPEIMEMKSRVNHGEVSAIDNFLTLLKKSNGYTELSDWLKNQSQEEKEIGLISFYGKQVGYLQKMLKEKHPELPIRLSTVDRFQGMERNIIIVSMVRSDKLASSADQAPDYSLYGELGYPKQNSLGFAESPNRLNVGLSRARRLLVIVGNKELFSTKEIYRNVYQTIAGSNTGKVVMASDLIQVLKIDRGIDG